MPLRAFWPLLRLSRPHARPTALNEFDTSPLKSLPDCVDMAWLAHARLEIGDDGHRHDRMFPQARPGTCRSALELRGID